MSKGYGENGTYYLTDEERSMIEVGLEHLLEREPTGKWADMVRELINYLYYKEIKDEAEIQSESP